MDRYLLQSATGERIAPKTIHLIRHGESTHNAHVHHQSGADLNDALYIDAPLTRTGIEQAKGLSSIIPTLDPELIITSPMTRATQTCLHALEGATAPIMVHPLCTERLAYACDIGNTANTLQGRFPMLEYGQLSDIWWWTPPTETVCTPEKSLEMLRMHPPGAYKTKFIRGVEPVKELQKRVDEFRLWLLGRPERRVVVFAHGVFNATMLGQHGRISNCEVRKLVL